MRLGENPQKEATSKKNIYTFQIIIPVYIPNLNGYYKESLKIFQKCILSLQTTVHNKTFITVVNNGSCSEVVNYLEDIYKSKIIHEVIHTDNIGKINAILKGMAGHNFRLITIADADILFKNNWQQETISVFANFPKAGVVGLIPQSKLFTPYSFNLIFDRFFSKSLQFIKVSEPTAIILFYKSIGWETNFNLEDIRKQLGLKTKYCQTIVGCGHAVATYKKEIFKNLLNKTAMFKLGGNSETLFLDKEVLKYDGWRLTTVNNNAFHMGNTYEPWMETQINKLSKGACLTNQEQELEYLKYKPFLYFIKFRIFKNILKFKFIYYFFLRLKGVPRNCLKDY